MGVVRCLAIVDTPVLVNIVWLCCDIDDGDTPVLNAVVKCYLMPLQSMAVNSDLVVCFKIDSDKPCHSFFR